MTTFLHSDLQNDVQNDVVVDSGFIYLALVPNPQQSKRCQTTSL
ncbi:hypothetical protein BH10CHL1_BH10CHL1_01800 [soil metagenome]